MNKVMLVGRLTRDPELRSLPSGKHVSTRGYPDRSPDLDSGKLRAWKIASGPSDAAFAVQVPVASSGLTASLPVNPGSRPGLPAGTIRKPEGRRSPQVNPCRARCRRPASVRMANIWRS